MLFLTSSLLPLIQFLVSLWPIRQIRTLTKLMFVLELTEMIMVNHTSSKSFVTFKRKSVMTRH
jgi:hypothetical protein